MLSSALREVKKNSSCFGAAAALATFVFALVSCAGRGAAPKPAESSYVAAAVCAGCHPSVAKTYRQTGMGRSFSRPSAGNMPEDYAQRNRLFHRASGRSYAMLQRDGQWFQRRHQTEADGRETNALEVRIDYVIGSGNHARSYLHRGGDGRLIEMPVSWYAEGGSYWAMSPGYDRRDQQDFRRAIAFSCMFCHNGRPDPPPTEEGVFPATLPEGIDCQRCHGPGRAHAEAAARKEPAEAIRRAIVNPARLSRERQLDVCMQCHLEPTSRPLPNVIARFEHGPFDYRPGEPLTDYFLFFDRPGGNEGFEIAHAAYRLRKSKCFQASAMTCSTCHNPHEKASYKAACRGCHATAHAASAPGRGDCVSCHMPRRRTDDAVHVVMTDHYIQRRKPAGDLLAPRAERMDGGYRGVVVPYYPAGDVPELYAAVAQVGDGTNLEAGIPQLREAIERLHPAQPEFYVELAKAYSKAGNPAEAARWCDQALRIQPSYSPAIKELGSALMAAGDPARAVDVLRQATGTAARTNLGNAYLRLGRLDEAEQALRGNSEDPDAANLLGMIASARGDQRAAEEFFRQAIRLATDHAEAHQNLANLLAARRDYAQAERHFERAIAANPAYAEARHRYGLLLLAMGAIDRAQREIEASVRIKPGLSEAHRDLGDILAAKGRANEAAAEYRLAEKGQ